MNKAITKTELIDSISRLNQVKRINQSLNYEIVNSIAILQFGNELNSKGDVDKLINDIYFSTKNN